MVRAVLAAPDPETSTHGPRASARRPAAHRIDFEASIDKTNPARMSDTLLPGADGPVWRAMSADQRSLIRVHLQAWLISQSLHAAQGRLLADGLLIQQAPSTAMKAEAAAAAAEAGDHLRMLRALLERYQVVYPVNAALSRRMDEALEGEDWAETLLMCGLLLKTQSVAMAQLMRDFSGASLVRQCFAEITHDLSRQIDVARGHLALHNATLTAARRAPREARLIDAARRFASPPDMRDLADAFRLSEIHLDKAVARSQLAATYRDILFQRLTPLARAAGFWSERVRYAFEELGVLHHADLDVATFLASDARIMRETRGDTPPPSR